MILPGDDRARALRRDDVYRGRIVPRRCQRGGCRRSRTVHPDCRPTLRMRACELAQVGWGVNATLVRLDDAWCPVEVDDVDPHRRRSAPRRPPLQRDWVDVTGGFPGT